MCAVALGYRRIRLMDQALALCPVTDCPTRRSPLQLRSRRCQFPSPPLGAGSTALKPRLRFGQPPRLDAEPAVPGGALNEQEIVELAAVGRAVDGVDHLLPQWDRPHVQVVVAERGRAQNPRVSDEKPAFAREV